MCINNISRTNINTFIASVLLCQAHFFQHEFNEMYVSPVSATQYSIKMLYLKDKIVKIYVHAKFVGEHLFIVKATKRTCNKVGSKIKMGYHTVKIIDKIASGLRTPIKCYCTYIVLHYAYM